MFTAQLQGEHPPTLEIARELCRLASAFAEQRPWEALNEDLLVLIRDPGSEEIHCCSVMGALGQVYSLTVYVGATGYDFFRRMHADEIVTTGDFFALQHAIYVHFVPSNELTKPDRELLDAVGWKRGTGARPPQFRTIRPGYHPWYVTEGEAAILAEGLRATSAFFKGLEKEGFPNHWSKPGRYPMMSRIGNGAGEAQYTQSMASPPKRATAIPKAVPIDEPRVKRILARGLPHREALEVDQFYGAGMVGEKNERKMCIRLVVAINSETAHAFKPETGPPEQPIGELLSLVVLNAIEEGRSLPDEVRVSNALHKSLLDPLARALGFKVTVSAQMPAFDYAKAELLKMMGDPGTISPS